MLVCISKEKLSLIFAMILTNCSLENSQEPENNSEKSMK